MLQPCSSQDNGLCVYSGKIHVIEHGLHGCRRTEADVERNGELKACEWLLRSGLISSLDNLFTLQSPHVLDSVGLNTDRGVRRGRRPMLAAYCARPR